MTIHKRKSFTLVELLVVIAIIGILSSIGIVVIPSQRARARNSQRVTDVQKIKLAMERYYEKNGKYPFPAMPKCRNGAVYSCEKDGIDHGPAGGDHPNSDCQVDYDQSWTSLYNDFLKPYIDVLPNDPLVESSVDRHYTVLVGGPDDNHQHYMITANLENSGAAKLITAESTIHGADSVRVISRYWSEAGGPTGWDVANQTVAVFRSWAHDGELDPGKTCESTILGSPADGIDILCGKPNSSNAPYEHYNVLCVGNIAGDGYWSSRDVIEKRANGTFTAPGPSKY